MSERKFEFGKEFECEFDFIKDLYNLINVWKKWNLIYFYQENKWRNKKWNLRIF